MNIHTHLFSFRHKGIDSLCEHRLAWFHEVPQGKEVSETPQAEGAEQPEGVETPITDERIKQDIDKALSDLWQIGNLEETEEARKKLHDDLTAIRQEYEALEKGDVEKLQALREQIIQQFTAIFERHATEHLQRMPGIDTLSVQNETARFTFNGTTVEATFNEFFEITSLTLQDTIVTLEKPLRRDAVPTVLRNSKAALGRIRERFPDATLTISSASGSRFEFSVQRGETSEKWVATSEDLLRVKEAPSDDLVRQWQEQKLKVRHMERELHETMRSSGMERMEMFMHRMKKDPMMERELSRMKPEEQAAFKKVWEQVQTLQRSLATEQEKERALHKQAGSRTLERVNAQGKPVQIVQEQGSPQYSSNFERTYVDGDGKLQKSMRWVSDTLSQIETYEDGEKMSTVDYDFDGRPKTETLHREGATDIFDPETGKRIIRRVSKEGEEATYLFDDQGKKFSTFDREQANNPEISEDQYLDMLAKKLNTPEKLWRYIETYFHYVHDSNDPENPLKKGTDESHGDYWQTPQETVRRVDDGRILGDCDDWAFFAREVLRRQGKLAHALSCPSHATCIWVEKRSDGKYDAYSIGTFGLDKNGQWRGFGKNAQDGYPTIREALQAIANKFQQGGLGARDGFSMTIEHSVNALDVPSTGKKSVDSIPLTALIDANVSRIIHELHELERSDPAEAKKRYWQYANQYPQEPDLLLKLEDMYRYDRSPESRTKLKTVYEKLIVLEPSEPCYEQALGEWHHDEKQYTQALEHYDRALQKGSRNTWIFHRLEEIQEQLTPQQQEQVHTMIRSSAKRVASNLEAGNYADDDVDFVFSAYSSLGEREKIIPVFHNRVLAIDASIKQRTTASEAIPTEDIERYQEALSDLLREQVFADQMQDAKTTFVTLKQELSAEDLFRKLPHKNSDTYQPELAAMYEETISQFTAGERAHVDLAEYLLIGNEYERALNQYEQAIKKNTDNSSVIDGLQTIKSHVDLQQWQSVATLLQDKADTIVQTIGTNEFVDPELYFATESYRLLGSPEKAVQAFRKRIAWRKQQYDDLKDKGTAEGRPREWIEYQYAYDELAFFYGLSDQPDKAIAVYREMLDIFGNNPDERESIMNKINRLKPDSQ